MKFMPEKALGKLSATLTALSLLIIAVFFAFMSVGLVNFDIGHWWDVTLGIAVPLELVAFILSIIAVRKQDERSAAVYISVAIGICSVLFLLLHSLFIHD